MITARCILLLVVTALCACRGEENKGNNGSGADLCLRTFEPYQDLISGRVRNEENARYVDAMVHYSAKEYAAAAEGLTRYLERKGAAKSAYLYLACCDLALGKPYDAELHIDQLEMSNVHDFKDQCEWYTVLCWLCSQQDERALDGAESIARAQHR